jgi:hypothetical protein
MNPRFALFWARVLMVVGMLFVGLGVTFAAMALALDMPWGRLTGQAVVERMLATVVLLLSGLVAGAPLIVMAEMLRVFLDQRRLLAEIKHRLESQPGAGGGSP